MRKAEPDSFEPMDLSETRPILRVFVAYEGAQARSDAWQLYRLLAGDLAGDMDIRPVFCHFGVITTPAHTEEANKAVIDADVVLFALSARVDLAAPMRAWMETWVEKRALRGGGLLIAIQHAPGPSKKPTANQLHLKDVARRAGMEFLAETVHPTARRSSRHRRGSDQESIGRHIPSAHQDTSMHGHAWAERD